MIGPSKRVRALLIAAIAVLAIAAGAYYLRVQAAEGVTQTNGTTVTQPKAANRGEQNEKSGQPDRDNDGDD